MIARVCQVLVKRNFGDIVVKCLSLVHLTQFSESCFCVSLPAVVASSETFSPRRISKRSVVIVFCLSLSFNVANL